MYNKNMVASESSGSYIDTDQFRAAYALNMCTVSVSQIVDYNDIYILEQEYEAILNNLNLERMPKDEALLNILIELLNTITFFRIQEIKKNQIDKEYQDEMKNAIWSAVPNFNVIVGTNPISMAISLATQVGVGYMNYRKKKASIASEKDKKELELQITAIEQFNALRRELFTTAWRLASAYNFPDEYRLTERQIKQYNEILMDQNEIRKYVRLESIRDKFMAYPPFWYYLGHTASYIAGSQAIDLDARARNDFREMARQHFETYWKMIQYNILREDQMTASFALEYIDLLLEQIDDMHREPALTGDIVKTENEIKEKIGKLIDLAVDMAGNALDVIQLCAIAYLRIGRTEEAADMLKRLVNEGYNEATNAKILSRILVTLYMYGGKDHREAAARAYDNYQLLSRMTSADYMFPMPDSYPDDVELTDSKLQQNFFDRQKRILKSGYSSAITSFQIKYIKKFNRLLVIPNHSGINEDVYYGISEKAGKIRLEDARKALENNRAECIDQLGSIDYEKECRGLLIKTVNDLDTLSIFGELETRKRMNLIGKIAVRFNDSESEIESVSKKLYDRDGFNKQDLEELYRLMSYRSYTEDFYDELQSEVIDAINSIDDLNVLNKMESDLMAFCGREDLDFFTPVFKGTGASHDDANDDILEQALRQNLDQDQKMLDCIREYSDNMVIDSLSVRVLISGSEEFKQYFKKDGVSIPIRIRNNALAVIDDLTSYDKDLIFTNTGIAFLQKKHITSFWEYNRNNITLDDYNEMLNMYPEMYDNENVRKHTLYRLTLRLCEIYDEQQ